MVELRGTMRRNIVLEILVREFFAKRILLKESQCDKISSWIFYLIWDYYGLYCLTLL